MKGVRAAALALALTVAPVAGSVLVAERAWAVDPEDQLPDPAQEERARALSKDLRCLVCAGQTIDESNSPVAHALRKMVRERILAGDTDAQVLDAVEARYGEYALLKPRFNAANFLLWTGPFLVLLLGGYGAWRYVRANRSVPDAAPLTDEERAALDRLRTP